MTITFSFISGEIIVPGTPIKVFSPRPIHPTSARSGTTLSSADETVHCVPNVQDGVVTLNTSDLPSNVYCIRVDPLLDSGGDCINSHPISSCVVIRKMKARVPRDYIILHVVHLAIGDVATTRLRPGEECRPGTQYIEVVQIAHRQTGKSFRRYFDQSGDEIDGSELLRAVAQRRQSKYGRVHEDLWKQLENSEQGSSHDVVIWPLVDDDSLTTYPAEYTDGTTRSHETDRQHDVFSFDRSKAKIMQQVLDLGAECRDHSGIPRICANLTARQIRTLAQSNHVGTIFKASSQRQLQAVPNLRTTMLNISRANRVHDSNILGEGIKVADWEAGPSDLTDMAFEDGGRFSDHPDDGENKLHARLVSAIIKSVDRPDQPRGYAPLCKLYSANTFSPDALIWAVKEKQCTVINISWDFVGSESSGAMNEQDVFIDWVATQRPWPTIVMAAGNEGRFENNPKYVANKSFNAIIVGAHNYTFRKDISEDRMAYFSNFINPTSPHADRELPSIAAPGAGISVLGTITQGTSFASPAVAGAVALIQSVHRSLSNNPEACRAIILAGAGRNVRDGQWAADVSSSSPHKDGRDGVGALDVEAAVKIAQRLVSPSTERPLSPWGWYHDVYKSVGNTLHADRKVFRTRITVPSSYQLGIVSESGPSLNLRAVVTWNSKVKWRAWGVGGHLSLPTINLELKLLDARSQQLVAFSVSFDNNYEVLDFIPTMRTDYDLLVEEGESQVDHANDGVAVAVAWCLFYNDEIV
ncbi:MAG: hypothetical protein Q9209_004485 [Squamulea sp. 1 TL-2023]